MAEHYSRRILTHLADRRYAPCPVSQLARQLGVESDDYDEFRRTVKQLQGEGRVVLGPSDCLSLSPPGKQVLGTFRLHERGFGFIEPDAPAVHSDLFVPPGQTADAMNGDHVRARVIRQKSKGVGSNQDRFVGRIVEILQRCDRRFVGVLLKQGRIHTVKVDGRSALDSILIRDAGASGAAIQDKVIVEIIRYPEGPHEQAEGVITEVLGEAGNPGVETVAVMRTYGLPEHFPENVLGEARRAVEGFADAVPPDREDLTRQFVCTIDPPDARDFDDAISLRRTDIGFELGVHIADVARFVAPGSALDEEARRRGNSTYLPRRVVPMLPEVLSNGVCSLQESVNRFAKSCFITMDQAGRPLRQRFARTVIRSAKRLTYLEAQALIDGDVRRAHKHACTEPQYPEKLLETLMLMDELARLIRHRRLGQGMIVLDLPEAELVFDPSGRVANVVPEDNAFTHTIIEMFMVEANEAAARLFDAMAVPMIRRIHDEPSAHDTDQLRTFARVAGYNIPANPTRVQLQQLLAAVEDKPARRAVHMAVLRTLAKAEYRPSMIGHFALASDHYTHFTSPIRRYADLIIHRGIDATLDVLGDRFRGRSTGVGKAEAHLKRSGRVLKRDQRVPDEVELEQVGRHCSVTERNSEAAERELRTYLVLEFLCDHLGEPFDGTVTGVTARGVYVQIDRYLVDGFMAASDLPGGGAQQWRLNSRTGALVAQGTGRSIAIGHGLEVRIATIDLSRRHMELVVAGTKKKSKASQSSQTGGFRKQPAGVQKSHQQTKRVKRQRKRRS